MGTVILEHSATVIRGRAIRHNCSAINTSFGEGLQVIERESRGSGQWLQLSGQGFNIN